MVALLDLPAARTARLLALGFLDEAAAARERLQGGDAEGLHDFRVGVRRLRSTLRAYRPHLEGSVRRGDRRRLRALTGATGAGRDTEVLVEMVEGWRGRLSGEERAGADRLLERLRGRRARAGRELDREVAADFGRVRKRLGKRLRRYRAEVDPADPAGGPRAGDAVRAVAEEMAEALREALDGVRSVADQTRAHRARIAAKRLRYLLEPFAGEVEGLPAAVRRLKGVQDLLGEMHDAHVLHGEVAAALDDPAAAEADPDPRPGLRALAERAAAERGRLFEAVEAAWLAPGAGGFFEELREVAARMGGAGEDQEVERKYLLRGFPELGGLEAEVWEVEQGWLPGERLAERVRRVRAGGEERWYRTVKLGKGVRRTEVEEETPAKLGRALWKLTRGKRVRKRRYRVADGALVWEIDRFHRRRLVLAEVELPSEDAPVELPEWLRPYVEREVTGDPAYVNLNLAR